MRKRVGNKLMKQTERRRKYNPITWREWKAKGLQYCMWILLVLNSRFWKFFLFDEVKKRGERLRRMFHSDENWVLKTCETLHFFHNSSYCNWGHSSYINILVTIMRKGIERAAHYRFLYIKGAFYNFLCVDLVNTLSLPCFTGLKPFGLSLCN